jgi:thiol-disulfide isomerase/thioredoxin
VILFTIPITAQWQPEIQLTNDSTSSYLSRNNARCIVADNSLINIVWTDLRDGRSQVYHKRSTDSGISWGIDSRLSNGPSESFDPSIAFDGQNLHVVWDDWRNGAQVFYKRSSDGGSSWCPHCKTLLPQISQLYNNQKIKEVEVVAVSIDTSKSDWQNFINTNKFSWINVRDSDGWEGKSVQDYFIYATPAMFLVDNNKILINILTDIDQIKGILN